MPQRSSSLWLDFLSLPPASPASLELTLNTAITIFYLILDGLAAVAPPPFSNSQFQNENWNLTGPTHLNGRSWGKGPISCPVSCGWGRVTYHPPRELKQGQTCGQQVMINGRSRERRKERGRNCWIFQSHKRQSHEDLLTAGSQREQPC